MQQVFTYYQRARGVQGSLTGLPTWGRLAVGLAALPGFLLAVLSILIFVVSIIALLLLAVPVFRLMQSLSSGVRTVGSVPPGETQVSGSEVFAGEVAREPGVGGSGRRTVEARVVDG